MAAYYENSSSSSLCYDIVIVGAGPSACGLLYGILRRHLDNSANDQQQTKTQQKQQKLPFTIAVLDRGISCTSSSDGTDTGTCAHRRNPSDWFKASHYDSNQQHQEQQQQVPVLQTIPQPGLGGRIVTVPVGSGLGGTTNINACLVSTPAERDFDHWPRPWRGRVMMDAAQHLEDVLRCHGAIEETEFGGVAADVCCNDASTSSSSSSLAPAHFPSLVSKVVTSTKAIDSSTTGKRRQQRHERVNYYDGLVRPLLDKYPHLRQHVTFLEGFHVQRITFGGDDDNDERLCATGVECNVVVTGKRIHVTARQQVILCSGAILSPALLMVSGIGPPDILSKKCINIGSKSTARSGPPPDGWNMIGQGLTDHIILPRAFVTLPNMWRGKSISGIQCWHNQSIDPTASDPRSFQLAATDGTCSTQLIPHFVAALFRRGYHCKTRASQIKGAISIIAFHTIRWILSVLMLWTPIGLIVNHCTATINISLLNPMSKGSVSVQRKQIAASGADEARLDEFDILVDAGYLCDIRDVAAMKQGWNLSEGIRVKYFANCWEILPSVVYKMILPWFSKLLQMFGQKGGKDWIFRYATDFTCPYFHWNGTCCMGDETTNDGTTHVVNSRLEVVGVERLRICDGSVFPSNVSCPPALTCACLGYIASESIILS